MRASEASEATVTPPGRRPSTVLPIESVAPGIDWPAVPTQTGAWILSVISQLEESQWWPPEVLAEHQFEQLAGLVDHAARTVPFYRERLAATGWKPGDILTSPRWRELPVLTRAELQAAGPTIVSTAVPADHGTTFTLMTSGSTGRPVQTVGTQLTQLFWSCLTVRDHLWHERDFAQTLAVVRQFAAKSRPPPEGASGTNWGTATRGLMRTGPCALLGIEHPVHHQAEWLERVDPGYLLTYPSNALALAQHFASHGRRLPALREVRTFGEVLEPKARVACRDALGVPVVDMYSSQEVGYLALQCPDHEHYHAQSEHLLVEVLDDAGEPCRPGQVGRVVVTTLHNFATPLLRYEVGDYAEVGGPCPCGRGLPVLTRILGRQRNMLVLPNGHQRWPTFGEPEEFQAALAGLPAVQQFQVVQRTVGSLDVTLVTERPLQTAEEDVVRDYLASSLGHRFDVTFRYVDEIARSAGGKFEDFRSDVVT